MLDAQTRLEPICPPPTDSDDQANEAQIDNLNGHKEIYQTTRYTPGSQLKIKLAMLICQVNMNKKDSNALLNLIRGISKMKVSQSHTLLV